MAIYEITSSAIKKIDETTFCTAGLKERYDLQRLLREQVDVISPGTLVIAEEFGEWEESKRRIDLLGIDKEANLVVIELKRTEDGGHMDLQAVRYAAMVSTMTFEKAVEVYYGHLRETGSSLNAQEVMLEFLGWDEPDEDRFGQDVRIVLASAEFSKELTTAVLWLNQRELDIRCVRLRPYSLDGRVLMDVQQIVPLLEAADYQVQVREKSKKERESRVSNVDFTRFDVTIDGQSFPAQWKRNAIYLVCKRLCENGVPPDKITELMDWRRNRVWRVAPGQLGSGDFLQAMTTATAQGEGAFDAGRWYCDEGQLVHANGKTYAFSNQWGGEKWQEAMVRIKAAFPDAGISYTACG